MAWWATNALFLRYLTPANFFSRIEFQYVNTYILCLSIYAFIHTILQFEYSTLLSVFYFHMSEIKFQMHSPSSPLNNSWMLSLDLKVKHLYGAVDSPKLKIKKKTPFIYMLSYCHFFSFNHICENIFLSNASQHWLQTFHSDVSTFMTKRMFSLLAVFFFKYFMFLNKTIL